MLTKLKRLVTGERVDLATGEVVDPKLRLREPVNSTPMAPPVNYVREPSMMDVLKGQMLKWKVDQLQAELGAETADEAEDFDVDDPEGFEPSSPHEHERHDMELLVAFEKLQRHDTLMHQKYGKPLPDYLKELGGEGGRPPRKAAPAAGPKPPEGAPAAPPAPRSDVLDPPED